MLRWLILTVLLGQALAHHTAINMFDVAKTAFEQEGKGYVLLESYLHLFENQGDSFEVAFPAKPGLSYKIVVLTDGEVLNNADVSVLDGEGKLLFAEDKADTFRLVQEVVSSGSGLNIRIKAAKMPEREGYSCILILEKST